LSALNVYQWNILSFERPNLKRQYLTLKTRLVGGKVTFLWNGGTFHNCLPPSPSFRRANGLLSSQVPHSVANWPNFQPHNSKGPVKICAAEQISGRIFVKYLPKGAKKGPKTFS
jgi:hypothetical protein